MIGGRIQQATVVAVTSGKGGVGKTNLAINLAAGLARLGHRVALIDGDFALGSVDVMLGLTPRAHIGHLLSGECELEDVLIAGPCGVRVLPASSGIASLVTLSVTQRDRLDAAVAALRATSDFLIIDTAPGLGDQVVDLLKIAQHVLLITSFDPAAMVDAYAIAKLLWQAAPGAEIGLVANGVRDGAEGRLVFRQIHRAAARFLGEHLRYLGFIPADPAVRESVAQQRAFVDSVPQAPASRSLRLLANKVATFKSATSGIRLVRTGGSSHGGTEVGRCA